MTRYYLSRVTCILLVFLAFRASWLAAKDGGSLLMLPLWLGLSMGAYLCAPSYEDVVPVEAE